MWFRSSPGYEGSPPGWDENGPPGVHRDVTHRTVSFLRPGRRSVTPGRMGVRRSAREVGLSSVSLRVNLSFLVLVDGETPIKSTGSPSSSEFTVQSVTSMYVWFFSGYSICMYEHCS